jgi:hypothetical protein
MFISRIRLYVLIMPFATAAWGQNFVSDSLVVNFGKNRLQKITASIDTIIDKRTLSPNCIEITEKKHSLFIPVDYRILISKPLNIAIDEMFSKKFIADKRHYKLVIKKFNISSIPGPLKNRYTCDAIISIFNIKDTTCSYTGTLVYEVQKSISKYGQKPGAGYEHCIDAWKNTFAKDMNAIASSSLADSINTPDNFIKITSDFRKNMICSADLAIGQRSWLVDGEILFSNPEPHSLFNRTGLLIRYRHEKEFESIEFSLANNQINYRLNNNLICVMKTKAFFGLNNWDSNEYTKHGWQDIFIFDSSISQHLIYNPFYKKSFICGLGIMEDFTYIYSQRVQFKPYLTFQIGYKF